jgi:hypothetical protein
MEMVCHKSETTDYEFWYIKGQDGKWYRSEKKKSEVFDESFWQNFGFVPWCGF